MHCARIFGMFLFDCLLSVSPLWLGICFRLHQLLMGLFALAFLDRLSTDSLSDMHFLKQFHILHCAGSSCVGSIWLRRARAIASAVRASGCSGFSRWGARAVGLRAS